MNKRDTKKGENKSFKLWLHKIIIVLAIKIIDITDYAKSEVVRFATLIIPVVSVVISSILFLPYFQKIIMSAQNLSAIYLASGALIGTILALVVSLSILPIQKSVEIFTPSFTKIYRADKGLIVTFLFLSLFCILSFLFSVDNLLKIGNNFLFPIQILILGLSFQCVKYYQYRVSLLLDPQNAIESFFLMSKKNINRASMIINFLTCVMLLLERNVENRGKQSIGLKSELFGRSAIIANIVNQVYEVSEISKKAIKRGESHLARITIKYLSRIAIYYLKKREDNLTLTLQDIRVFGCDADNLLGPVYEELLNICRTATKNDCEEISQAIIEEFGHIAIFIGTLKCETFKHHNSPISWKPISYLKLCIDDASKFGMREALLTGAKTYSKISPSTAAETDQLTLINNQFDICIKYFLSGNAELVNEIIREMMKVGTNYILSDKFYRLTPFRQLLESFEALIPFGIAFEKENPGPRRYLPVDFPYNLEHELCLGRTLQRACGLIKLDKDRDWISPYHKFAPIYEKIWRHFRDLGDKIDFKSSFLLFHINQTILHICEVSLSIIEDGEKNEWDTSEVHNCVSWLLTFYWTAFSTMSEITEFAAQEAAETLSKIGLLFQSSNCFFRMEITESCASNISSIAEQFILKNMKANSYDIADVYIKIIHIIEFLIASKQEQFANKIEAKIKRPESIEDEKWNDILSKIEHRKKQLYELLNENKYMGAIGFIDRSEGILKQLLSKINQEK